MEHLEGLPEHVVPVRYGVAKVGEFVFHGRIHGPIGNGCHGHGLIVRPEDGYEFVYDISTDEHVPVKRLDQPKTVKAVFTVTNEHQLLKIRRRAAELPGFQEIEEPSAQEEPSQKVGHAL
ncbi:MAG TPA: hypothetical protein PLP04_19710 [Bryobacteraceae bacterium]|nr:hypothetical protein [Bryobacteraceae bacterium]HPQ17464.1 hypothetical protein [Bryobacteraceae bacterium]